MRVFSGVYVVAGTPDTFILTAKAALLAAPPQAVLARQTAARMFGGVVPHIPQTCLAVPPGVRCRVDGLDVRTRAAMEVGRRQGLPLTNPTQTFCDLAEDLDLVDLVVLGDSLVGAGAVSVERLVEAAGAFRGRGARRARRAASCVRAGVDSPMETRLRMLIVLAGLPEPVVNLVLRYEDGAWEMRLDLAYPAWQIAVEYDGRQHAESVAQWRRDVGRRERLETKGWRLIVVLAGDIYTDPRSVLDRLVAAIAQRGGRVAVSCSEWSRHFPGRRAA